MSVNWTTVLVTFISSALTGIVAFSSSRYNFKNDQRKAILDEDKNETESITKTNDEWERLYKTQKDANDDLKKDYELIKKQISEMQNQIGDLKSQVSAFGEKEEGYKLRIEQLENENDDLREENDTLKERINQYETK